jgi:outer membrane receptor for ferric coprogen and ferric-rhodotorulic acid
MFKLNTITATLLLSTAIVSTVASADSADTDIERISITGTRDNRVSAGATGLMLGIQDTPQSISVIDSDTMSLFGADNINDALDLVTGVSVERWETNRTNCVFRFVRPPVPVSSGQAFRCDPASMI